jgi:predicted lysophospholipase L1 biosynthesis ABC-type transport system permease subunit
MEKNIPGVIEIIAGYIITALIVLIALGTLAIVLSVSYGIDVSYLVWTSGCCAKTAMVTPSLIALSALMSTPSIFILRNASPAKRKKYILAGVVIVIIGIIIACVVFCSICAFVYCKGNMQSCLCLLFYYQCVCK